MRFAAGLALVGLLGCGSAGHDGASGGSGGKNGAAAGDGTPAQHGAGTGAAGTSSGQAGNAAPAAGSGNGAAGSGSDALRLPRVYPLLRANTPTNLIANAAYREGASSLEVLPGDDAGVGGAIGLAQAVQERLYSQGPTEILRIVQELDNRTSQLDLSASRHGCLGAAAIARDLMFPGGQTFRVQLQCMREHTGGWLAFGIVPSQSIHDDADAGAAAVTGHDVYLVQGQDGGMGGAYHVRASGDVEAWITVADGRVPNNSQVLMHLLIDAAAGTTELAFGGSGVGFCSAHLKTGQNHLYILAKTNAPPPPGQSPTPGTQYCDAPRGGCFATDALSVDLGAAAPACAAIDSGTFGIGTSIDASSGGEANVAAPMIYELFNVKPTGIAAY